MDCLSSISDRIKKFGVPIREWTEEDSHGLVKYAQVLAFGDTTHTLVERNNYPGTEFLPNWRQNPLESHLTNSVWCQLPDTGLKRIDHLAMNQLNGTGKQVGQWYNQMLNFKRFWSNDDTIINTDSSGLRAIFMINGDDETVKLTINEPISGSHKSQIQEFLDYHQGPGVQHIAFHTDDICESVMQLENRGTSHFDHNPNRRSITFRFFKFKVLNFWTHLTHIIKI